MDTYSPIFARIVDSSLWSEPDFVVKVFITMIAKQDSDHVVRGSAYNIASWAKKTEAEVIEALKILAAPDTKRIEPQLFDGRRVERVNDGWLLLNGAAYQALMQAVNRRAYQRDKQREYRASKKEAAKNGAPPKGKPLPGEVEHVANFEAGREDEYGRTVAATPAPKAGLIQGKRIS
jgi:hypothetical protein